MESFFVDCRYSKWCSDFCEEKCASCKNNGRVSFYEPKELKQWVDFGDGNGTWFDDGILQDIVCDNQTITTYRDDIIEDC